MATSAARDTSKTQKPKPPVTVREHVRRAPTPRPNPVAGVASDIASGARSLVEQGTAAVGTLRNRLKTIQDSIREPIR